jgi:hypothetical protein
MDWTTVLTIWTLSGTLAWWLGVRYLSKELYVKDFYWLPIHMLGGTMWLVAFLIGFACLYLDNQDNKLLKNWRSKND